MKLKTNLIALSVLGLLFLSEFASAQATCGDMLLCSGAYAMYIKAQSGTLGLWLQSQNKNAIQAKSKSCVTIVATSRASWGGKFLTLGSGASLGALLARAEDAQGVWGESKNYNGVNGISTGGTSAANGVYGETNSIFMGEAGVFGHSTDAASGVIGYNSFAGLNGFGGRFESHNSYGVYCLTSRADKNYGLYTPDNVYIGGKIDLNGVVDPVIGERFEFDPEEELEAGDVMVIEKKSQYITRCTEANDTKVLGIIGPDVDVQNGEVMVITFGNRGAQPVPDADGRIEERTVIKVKVDAAYGAIERGDLLTTSPTPGHAMKAVPVDVDGTKIYRPGTIIGKAMESLDSGTGIIEVFVLLN